MKDAFAKAVTQAERKRGETREAVKVFDPYPPAAETDKRRIPLRLIGYRVPHTDERCPRRSPSGVYCRSMRGHEGVHIGPDPYDPEASIWWF